MALRNGPNWPICTRCSDPAYSRRDENTNRYVRSADCYLKILSLSQRLEFMLSNSRQGCPAGRARRRSARLAVRQADVTQITMQLGYQCCQRLIESGMPPTAGAGKSPATPTAPPPPPHPTDAPSTPRTTHRRRVTPRPAMPKPPLPPAPIEQRRELHAAVRWRDRQTPPRATTLRAASGTRPSVAREPYLFRPAGATSPFSPGLTGSRPGKGTPHSPPCPLIAARFARTAGRVKGRGTIAKRRRKAPLTWSAGSPKIRQPGAGRPGGIRWAGGAGCWGASRVSGWRRVIRRPGDHAAGAAGRQGSQPYLGARAQAQSPVT